MPYSICFKHHRQEVIAQPGETVLAAAIRAGIQVDYGCNNGRCGQCLARLMQGEVKRTEHSDYVLSASEKQSKSFLMCVHTACSDLLLDAHKVSRSELVLQNVTTRISRKLYWDDGRLCQLILRLPRQKRLHFFAGQYLRIHSEHFPSTDCSIASCPCDVSCLEFHLSRSAESPMSDYIFSTARVGDRLVVEGPLGRFTLSEEVQNPIVFIAVDLGFASIKSLLEHLLAREVEAPIYLYRLSSKGSAFYLENLCRSWQDAFDNLSYHEMPMNPPDAVPDVISQVERLAEEQPVDVYLCAGQEFLSRFKRFAPKQEKIRLHLEPIRLFAPLADDDLHARHD